MNHIGTRLRRSVRVALASISLILAAACGIASGGTNSNGPAPGPIGVDAPVVQSVSAGACVDGTASSAARYAHQFVTDLAGAVQSMHVETPVDSTAAVAAQGSLHLEVRSVTTYSISTDDTNVVGDVPALPALPARPNPTTDQATYNTDIHSWSADESAWVSQKGTVDSAISNLASQVRSFPIDRHTSSGIYSCLAALASDLKQSPSASTRLMIETDAQNNQPVIGLNLRNDPVLMIEVCPAATSNGCPARFAAASKYLRQHGASKVSLIRADAVSPSTITNFWRAP